MESVQDLVATVYCVLEDVLHMLLGKGALAVKAGRLSVAESLTMAVVGEALGLVTDKAIHRYFSYHFRPWFPALGHRTTFIRQLWKATGTMEQLSRLLYWSWHRDDDGEYTVDAFPLEVCRLVRKRRCVRFRDLAATSYCASKKLYYYGLKGHALTDADGVLLALHVTPANTDDRAALKQFLPCDLWGELFADKGYICRKLQTWLRNEQGLRLSYPHRTDMKQQLTRAETERINGKRKIVETVISQLQGRFGLARLWARFPHTLASRCARKLLTHNVLAFLNSLIGNKLIQFDTLLPA